MINSDQPAQTERSNKSITSNSLQVKNVSHTISVHKRHLINQQPSTLTLGKHIREPHTALVFGRLTVDLIHVVITIWDQHLVHECQLSQPVTPYLHRFLHTNLAWWPSSFHQAFTAFSNTDNFLLQRLQPFRAHHQLHQPRAVQSDATQHLFANCLYDVQMGDGGLLTEELKLTITWQCWPRPPSCSFWWCKNVTDWGFHLPHECPGAL